MTKFNNIQSLIDDGLIQCDRWHWVVQPLTVNIDKMAINQTNPLGERSKFLVVNVEWYLTEGKNSAWTGFWFTSSELLNKKIKLSKIVNCIHDTKQIECTDAFKESLIASNKDVLAVSIFSGAPIDYEELPFIKEYIVLSYASSKDIEAWRINTMPIELTLYDYYNNGRISCITSVSIGSKLNNPPDKKDALSYVLNVANFADSNINERVSSSEKVRIYDEDHQWWLPKLMLNFK